MRVSFSSHTYPTGERVASYKANKGHRHKLNMTIASIEAGCRIAIARWSVGQAWCWSTRVGAPRLHPFSL
eukprot:6212705-Pleurochrysis_carterae.AAC.1